jgi:hypothetical protein
MWRHEAQRPSWPTDPTHKTNIPPHSQTLAVGASQLILSRSRSRNHMVRVALPTSVGGHHPRPAGGHHPCPAGHHLDASLLPRWPSHPLPLPPPLSPPPLFSLPSCLLGGTCGRWWGSFESDGATEQVNSATRWSLLPLWHPAQRPLPAHWSPSSAPPPSTTTHERGYPPSTTSFARRSTVGHLHHAGGSAAAILQPCCGLARPRWPILSSSGHRTGPARKIAFGLVLGQDLSP